MHQPVFQQSNLQQKIAWQTKSEKLMMDFPKAKIPTDPVLCAATFGWNIGNRVRCVLDAGSVKHVTSGRIAIAHALRQMGVTAGDQVLIPAYHSRSMVEPVIWAGAEPVFFRVHGDTKVDLEDVLARLTPRSKVVMAVNYFGFPQDLLQIRSFCNQHGLLMLEDCAHGFFGEHAGRPLGAFGDYAIGSTMKFLPVYDGGCLISARHRLDGIELQSGGLKFEVKTALNTLERAFAYDRMRPFSLFMSVPFHLKNFFWSRIKKQSGTTAAALGPKSSDGAFGFETSWLDKRASLMSRLLIRHASRRRIADYRRANYLRLLAAFGMLRGCRPLYPVLPAGTVPWVFPLVVDDADRLFPLLKYAGVPIVRFAEFLWDGVDERTCMVSADLSRKVLQFPCHQELKPAEIQWMIDSARTILSAAPEQVAA